MMPSPRAGCTKSIQMPLLSFRQWVLLPSVSLYPSSWRLQTIVLSSREFVALLASLCSLDTMCRARFSSVLAASHTLSHSISRTPSYNTYHTNKHTHARTHTHTQCDARQTRQNCRPTRRLFSQDSNGSPLSTALRSTRAVMSLRLRR